MNEPGKPPPPPPPPLRYSTPSPPTDSHAEPGSSLRQKPSGAFKKALGPLAVLGVLLAKFGKLALVFFKFIPVLLKTGGSMFVMIWVYAMSWGWWYAFGFVMLIFVHECGHLIAAKRLGLRVGAPVFIPFMGAIIALKDAPKNAMIESQVGIGGPLLGSIGAAICYLVYRATGQELFAALAYSGFMLNLFNLAPIGFLDGGRIVTVLSPWLWLVGATIVGGLIGMQIYFYHHLDFLLCLIFILSLPRLFSLFRRKTAEELRYYEATPQQRLIMGFLYFGLAAALTFGMLHVRVDPRGPAPDDEKGAVQPANESPRETL